MRYVEYHSKDWELLVETGWMTQTVEEMGGKRIAIMIPTPRRRWP